MDIFGKETGVELTTIASQESSQSKTASPEPHFTRAKVPSPERNTSLWEREWVRVLVVRRSEFSFSVFKDLIATSKPKHSNSAWFRSNATMYLIYQSGSTPFVEGGFG